LWPSQQSDVTSAGGLLVAGGQLARCKIRLTEALRKEDLELGIEDPRFKIPKVRTFDALVQVHWIEPSGQEYSSELKIGSYMFDEQWRVAGTQEMARKFSLYSSKVEVLPDTHPVIP